MHCLKALKNIRTLRGVAVAAMGALALFAAGSLVSASLQPAGSAAVSAGIRAAGGAFLGLIASFAAWTKLGQWETNFLVGAPSIQSLALLPLPLRMQHEMM